MGPSTDVEQPAETVAELTRGRELVNREDKRGYRRPACVRSRPTRFEHL